MSGDSREFDAVIENEFWINRNEEVLNRASVPQKKEEPDLPDETVQDSPNIKNDGPKPINPVNPRDLVGRKPGSFSIESSQFIEQCKNRHSQGSHLRNQDKEDDFLRQQPAKETPK